jgi:hypothetical protein
MKKQIIVAAVLSSIALSQIAFADGVQGSNSAPTTQIDSQGDMASGAGSYASGSTQTPGTLVQTQNGASVFIAPPPNDPSATGPSYLASYAAGYQAYAGPGKGETIYGNDTAVGSNSVALGAGSSAFGAYAWALGNSSTAIGDGSAASGLAATAIGIGSRATGTQSTATGVNADAGGNFSTATGGGAVASGGFSTASGYGSAASGFGAVADGAYAVAGGNGSTALGTAATAKGSDSVALGAGSVANRSDSVSVGNAATGMTRQIANVSAGTQGTDAVNVNQLDGTAASLHQQIQTSAQQIGGEINGVHNYATREADSVGALSAASVDAAFSAAGLRTPNRVALGIGEMGGQVAEGVAYQHVFGRHWTANATVADGAAGVQVGIGAGFGW